MAKEGARHLVSNIGGVLAKDEVLNSTEAYVSYPFASPSLMLCRHGFGFGEFADERFLIFGDDYFGVVWIGPFPTWASVFFYK